MGDVTIRGWAYHKPGPYGSKRPVCTADASAYAGTARMTASFLGTDDTNAYGDFLIDCVVTTPQVTVDIFDLMANKRLIKVLNTPQQVLQTPSWSGPPSVTTPPRAVISIGHFTVPWEPVLPPLATVNGTDYTMHSTLAQALAARLRQPSAYPAKITLQRQVLANPLNNLSEAEDVIGWYQQDDFPIDLPARIAEELGGLSGVPSGGDTVTQIAAVLDYLSTVGVHMVENELLIKRLLEGIESAFGFRSILFPQDPVPDIAAISVLLYIAGLIEKDGAKASVSFGTVKPSTVGAAASLPIEYRAVFVTVDKK